MITIRHDPSASAAPTSSVIVLHGLGDTAQGWTDVAQMWAESMPSSRFVLPTAPQRAVTLNGGMRMPAWYDIKSLDKNVAGGSESQGIDESKATIDALIASEAALVGGAGRVVLAGFSQGGALALYVGLQRESEPLAAVVSMSGYMPKQGAWQVGEASRSVPVGFFHGDADQVVQYDWAVKSMAVLRTQGVTDLKLATYPQMGHSACQQEIADVARFVSNALSPTSKASL